MTKSGKGCAALDSPWSRDADEVLEKLDSSLAQGLTDDEAERRLRDYGPNVLRARRPRSVLAILADQFRSLVVLLLAAAAVVAFFFDDHAEGFAILAVLIINSAIGFVTEWRATRSMEALRRLGRVDTRVRRDGAPRQERAERLVPGDIVLLEAGDVVTADLRIVEASKLAADESTLTGESVPVAKQVDPVAADAPVMERASCLFKGTTVTRGAGTAVVTATGFATELGRISELVTSAKAQVTPLERRLNALGQKLVWATLVIAALIALAGIAVGRELVMAIQVAVALAVAAIPEGLPIVATIALARGMWRMAQRNALIVRLSAVETLGATGVILSDKTGTLTENRMSVARIELPSGAFVPDDPSAPTSEGTGQDELLTAVALCSNASLETGLGGEDKAVGDPTETALLMAAAGAGLQREALVERMPELREEPFDPATKAMATFNRAEGGVRVSVKGAPEAVLPMCSAVRVAGGDRPMETAEREALERRATELAGEGLRMLAVATRTAKSDGEEPYRELVYLGMVGLLDPPRPGVREAISRCREAGIRVVMVTGDHAATALNIARELGLAPPGEGNVIDARELPAEGLELSDEDLEQVHVIARATPQQKLELIALYQARGMVVAMTGDGVNDAPALKKADIGVAMGVRGTQVAREAAAMVLQDDEFPTIVEAIAQGRAIYANIRTFCVYLLSCNISEILVVGLATIAGAPLPLLPLQILFLNLVTDVFPALALGVSEGGPQLMRQRPRPAAEDILERRHWLRLVMHGLVMSLSVLGAMAIALLGLGFPTPRAVAVSFCTLAMAQLWHVFNMRAAGSHPLRNEITRNRWIWVAIALCVALIVAAVHAPGLSDALKLVSPGWSGWMLAVGMSGVPLLAGPLVARFTRMER